MEADYKKLLRFHNQEMKRMEREPAKAHSETVTVRKYWGGVMDDLDKEQQAEVSRLLAKTERLEKEKPNLARQRDNAKDKLKERTRQYYGVAAELEEERGKNKKLTAQLNKRILGAYRMRRKVYDKLLVWKKESSLTLEITGARQVGKTYIINKFAKENFAHTIYINMLEDSGEEFLKCLRAAKEWEPGKARPNQPLHKAFSLFSPDFTDTEDTVVIIDEIQETEEVYNLVREFTRKFVCRFIITGSYLGRTLNKNFKMSAGDLTSLRIETLDFEEFVDAFGKMDVYDGLQLYGTETGQGFEQISELFRLYLEIGGYPAVVTEYLQTSSKVKCREKLEDVIHLFCAESIRYFEDILDAAVYDNIFCSVARILHREKKGLDADNFSESLQKLVVHDYDSNISKAVCNRAIMWLQSAGILDFAGKVSECKIMEFKGRCRCFFTDVGLTYYFLRKIGADRAGIQGMLHENYVFLELRRKVQRLKEIALETPAFATYKGGEIDFYVKSLEGNEKAYAVEVKFDL